MPATYLVPATSVLLSDDFDGTALNTALWSSSGSEVAVSDGQLQLTTDLSPSTKKITSVSTFDLTGQYCSCELASVPTTLNSLQVFLEVSADSTHRVQWALSQGVLYVNVDTGSGDFTPSGESVTFDPVAHKFLRIREDSGTTYWEYSADGSAWTTFYGETSPVTLTSITLNIIADTYETETSQATVSIDNVFIGSDIQLTITTP